MQFTMGNSYIQCLLVLTAIFVSVSNGLLCTTCLDRVSCANRSETQECNEDLISLHHRLLEWLNPNIAGAQPNADYKCYELDMSYVSDLTGSTVLVAQKGCTYNTTSFCEGWINTTSVNRCSTCDTGDDCNKGQTEGTTTSVAPSTPLASTTTTEAVTTTTAAPGSPTTTTVAPGSTTTETSGTSSSSANPTTTTDAATSTTTAASSSTSSPANPTTTTVGTTTSSVGPQTTTTPKPAGSSACVASWVAVVGFALLQGLVARSR